MICLGGVSDIRLVDPRSLTSLHSSTSSIQVSRHVSEGEGMFINHFSASNARKESNKQNRADKVIDVDREGSKLSHMLQTVYLLTSCEIY